MVDIGIPDGLRREVAKYRDQVFRLVAEVNRRSGLQIAHMLLNAGSNEKGLERILGDALENLGFKVEELGQTGEPEGIATAPISPAQDHQRLSYRFTYDAKSTSKGRAQTGNIHAAGLARHKRMKDVEYALVVAPGFQKGALEAECEICEITPMLASDLAALLFLAFETGPLDLNAFREVFQLHDPQAVHTWVEELSRKTREQKRLTLDVFLRALDSIKFTTKTNAVSQSIIAHHIGELPDWVGPEPARAEVRAVISGLATLLPGLVRSGAADDVWFATSPEKIRQAILSQINRFPAEFRPESLTKPDEIPT